MELLLVRHALPVRRELVDGAADPELSADGHAQAEHLATYLSSEHLDAIYASPLRRAYQTAAPIAALRSVDVEVCDGVAEYDRLSPDYVPVEELKAENDPRYHAVIGGEWLSVDETADEFRARVVGTVEKLIDDHAGDRVAVVCHGGVINSYLCHVLGLSNPRGFFYPNYTSINRVAAARGGQRSIVTINETSHLRGTGLPMGLFQGQ
jgi:probable phosphoglycerate mutase